MKTSKLSIVGLLCISALLGLANCAPAGGNAGEGKFKAGTYTGNAPGKTET